MTEILHIYFGPYHKGNGIYSVINPLLNFEFNNQKHLIFTSLNWDLIKKLKENERKIIIIHGLFFTRNILLGLLLLFLRRTYYIKPHGSLTKASWVSKGLLKKVTFMILFIPIYLGSKRILFLTDHERINSWNIMNKHSSILPNFISLSRRDKENANLESMNSTPIRFLMLNRIDYDHKGIDLLLNFLYECSNDFLSKFVIDIFGSGNVKELKKLRKDFKLFGNINYHGYVDIDCLNWKDYNYLLLFSRYEGMPTVIIESLYNNLPLCISNKCNWDEDGSTGYNFNPYDYESIKSAFEKSINDTKIFKGLSDHGKQFILSENFNECEFIYRKLI